MDAEKLLVTGEASRVPWGQLWAPWSSPKLQEQHELPQIPAFMVPNFSLRTELIGIAGPEDRSRSLSPGE